MLATFTAFTLILARIATISAERTPREIPWADKTFGPDGPWRAIDAKVGEHRRDVNLFPGSDWETWLIEDDYCEKGTCYASEAGTYGKSSGTTAGISWKAALENYMRGVNLEGEGGTAYLDDLELGGITVTNASLAVLGTSVPQKLKYPGGQTAGFFAGCLSLGGRRETNQSFSVGDDSPTINASLPSGWLWENEYTESYSFGMHIGSVQPATRVPGSLWFGGYDQNRVVGEILSMNGGPRDGITLRDISIDVVGSKSPFEFRSKGGLLAEGNSSIGPSFKVLVDGCSPYLTLPESTCNNIASHLPVKFSKDLGLYLWDTKSEKYKEIISSASTLSFEFISTSNTNPVKIRIPFMHLNLTLEAPLVDNPVPYFPCHVNGGNRWVLGRAFLQDAFIGANMRRGVDTWWLAQAPGPNIQATANPVTIGEKDTTVEKGGNDWNQSWTGFWDDEQAPSSTPSSTDDTTDGDNKGEDEEEEEVGMTTAAKAGIGAGIAAAVIAIGVGAFIYWRRRRAQTQTQPAPETTIAHNMVQYYNDSKPQELPPRSPQELAGHGVYSQRSYQRFELP
ncbi:hypothetical protein NW752_011494 [Fusarium irregulare]|uniref:Peptidase A1 domain-containing protein n=1 Tax=Fusarium irregulare TaxID=2494466 RepID=A0A9W8PXP0_9HYPO|nr:hypothetical protein NW752_011494 [Fusarium irregulare]KAJ4019253.1 hypothetical protein NW766_002959 [Fusarium irregulare]